MTKITEGYKKLFVQVKELLHKYERYLSVGTLVVGFIIDSLTLTRADVWLDNLILLSYLVLSGGFILALNAHKEGRLQYQRTQQAFSLLPYALQFTFGGLFSGFVVLYSRSASLAASWPFLLILAALLVGNEYLRTRYEQLLFQLGIYYIAIFSYLIFAIPVAVDHIGPWVFILSGIISLGVISLIGYGLRLSAPQKFQSYKHHATAIIVLIYGTFNLLYFLHMIPPIPLSIKEMIVAHQVVPRSPNGFTVTYEPSRWYQLFNDNNPTYHRVGSEPIYIYTAIYTPTQLRTAIIHEWAFYNSAQEKWQVASSIQYPISGGREQGYRGYSVKTNIQPGQWRVTVKTQNGQILGRTKFDIENALVSPKLTTEAK